MKECLRVGINCQLFPLYQAMTFITMTLNMF